MPSIVQVNVQLQVAPTPETLQQTGALVSQGSTNTSQFTYSLLTQLSDLTPLLVGAKTIASMVLASGTVTATTTTPHGFTIGDTLLLQISGVTPAAYNGLVLATVTGASTFTYPLGVSPGAVSVQGVYTPENVAELVAMATTFFSQGANQSVYVLELGPGNANDGVASLSAYITMNPNSNYNPLASGYFYSYLVPRTWDANTNFLSLIASLNSNTAKTYFFVTTTLGTYTVYTDLQKCVQKWIESPAFGKYPANALTAISSSGGVGAATTTTAHGVAVGNWFFLSGNTPTGFNGWFQAIAGTTGSTLVFIIPGGDPGAETVLGTLQASYYSNPAIPALEFSAAAAFYASLNYRPGATSRVAPFQFQFLFGVTPFPTNGKSALLTTLQQNFVNIVGTGAEGGISNTIILWGLQSSGDQFNLWYSVDWVQITVQIDIANAVINGSNNRINPLFYNQDGINRLQAVAMQTMRNGVTFGMVLFAPVQTQLDGPELDQNLNNGLYIGNSVVNSIPFITYSQENPGDYKLGRYSGFSIIYTPQLGFENIVFNVLVTEFVAG